MIFLLSKEAMNLSELILQTKMVYNYVPVQGLSFSSAFFSELKRGTVWALFFVFFFLILSEVTKEETFLAEDNSWPIFSVALDGIFKKLKWNSEEGLLGVVEIR